MVVRLTVAVDLALTTLTVELDGGNSHKTSGLDNFTVCRVRDFILFALSGISVLNLASTYAVDHFASGFFKGYTRISTPLKVRFFFLIQTYVDIPIM